MALKQMKRCSTSLMWKSDIKNYTKVPFANCGMSKNQEIPHTVDGLCFNGHSQTLMWECKSLNPFWRTSQQQLSKWYGLALGQSYSTFEVPTGVFAHTWSDAWMASSTVTIAEHWKGARCQCIRQYLSNWCCVYSWILSRC